MQLESVNAERKAWAEQKATLEEQLTSQVLEIGQLNAAVETHEQGDEQAHFDVIEENATLKAAAKELEQVGWLVGWLVG